MKFEKIESWLKQTAVYPPNEIYAGMPQGKPEKRAIQLCENLYRFNFGSDPNILGNLRAAWRNVEVAMIINQDVEVKEEYLIQVFSEFLYWSAKACEVMDACFKSHQDVWKYYQGWRLKFKEIQEELKSNLPLSLYISIIKQYGNLL